MRRSPYTIYHSLAAAIVLLFAIKNNFWHTFIHGFSIGTPKPPVLIFSLACQVALFGLLVLFLWISTLFSSARNGVCDDDAAEPKPPNRKKAVVTALVVFVPICIVTLGLEWTCSNAMEKLFDIHLAQQDLVQWLQPDAYPLGVRLMLMAFVLFEAPLLEEPLFRGIMFRGLETAMPTWGAAVVSGFLFAIAHVNAATFIPLMFLGVAFAWLYRRTGSILAPMTVHFLFNALNLVLCLVFPDLAGC